MKEKENERDFIADVQTMKDRHRKGRQTLKLWIRKDESNHTEMSSLSICTAPLYYIKKNASCNCRNPPLGRYPPKTSSQSSKASR